MTTASTADTGSVPLPIPVRTDRHQMSAVDPLAAYELLAREFGTQDVFLLESAAGPRSDTRLHAVGFGTALTLSVRANEVHIDGRPQLAETVRAALAPMLVCRNGRSFLRRPRDLWPLLRALCDLFDTPGSASRFRFGFLAYFGYDTARYIEDLPYLIASDTGVPDVCFVLPEACLLIDRSSGASELLVHSSPAWPSIDPGAVTQLLTSGDRRGTRERDARKHPPTSDVSDETDYRSYAGAVDRALRHIAAGDIYQVQLGHEISIATDIDPLSVYHRLRTGNPSPFMYLATLADSTAIGASPELFVRSQGGRVTMRPIAGTAPRGEVDDMVAARRLRSDPKEIAEHAMLVDLCRNDVGRICAGGTLAVPERLHVDRYSHVLHLVSTVCGDVAADVDAFDVIAAMFPAGTMTGAPKIRSMEIIENLETSRRGLYAGAIGLVDVGGYLNLALCIRTLVHHAGVYRARASAGVVADSDPQREWRETLAKCSAASVAVTGRTLL